MRLHAISTFVRLWTTDAYMYTNRYLVLSSEQKPSCTRVLLEDNNYIVAEWIQPALQWSFQWADIWCRVHTVEVHWQQTTRKVLKILCRKVIPVHCMEAVKAKKQSNIPTFNCERGLAYSRVCIIVPKWVPMGRAPYKFAFSSVSGIEGVPM